MQDWSILAQVVSSTAPSADASSTAQGTAVGGSIVPSTQGAAAPAPSNPFMSFLPIVLVLVVMYLFLFRPKGKEAKQQKAMLESLKRGDRVMTIGGLIGSVVEVRGDEVVLKVDESNNVKERYIKSAIQKVLVDGDKADEPKK
jgi:preprotein translocase subunit YajC